MCCLCASSCWQAVGAQARWGRHAGKCRPEMLRLPQARLHCGRLDKSLLSSATAKFVFEYREVMAGYALLVCKFMSQQVV